MRWISIPFYFGIPHSSLFYFICSRCDIALPCLCSVAWPGAGSSSCCCCVRFVLGAVEQAASRPELRWCRSALLWPHLLVLPHSAVIITRGTRKREPQADAVFTHPRRAMSVCEWVRVSMRVCVSGSRKAILAVARLCGSAAARSRCVLATRAARAYRLRSLLMLRRAKQGGDRDGDGDGGIGAAGWFWSRSVSSNIALHFPTKRAIKLK